MSETIVALATPPGVGGLAVIRVSGETSFAIADEIFSSKKKIIDAASHTISYGKIYIDEALIDTVTAAVFKSPNSYTGEDVVEISCHGGQVVAKQIIEGLMQKGARLAEAGEFTRRAFLNGKLDLSQVEAVADLIHSNSIPAAQTAARQLAGNFTRRINIIVDLLLSAAGLLELELDFSEEDLEFISRSEISNKLLEAMNYCRELSQSHHSAEILRHGYFVGIAGYPNSGKSTLFNTLLKKHRAIVSSIAGTTRDYIEESIYIDDLQIRLADTAGIRETMDEIEIEGVKLVDSILKQSDLVLVINDLTQGGEGHSDDLILGITQKYPQAEVIAIHNKIDIAEGDYNHLKNKISAKSNLGIDELKILIGQKAKISVTISQDALVNQRQSLLLKQAESALLAAYNSVSQYREADMIALDIRDAARYLGEITGKTWSAAVLNQIFSQFCIGK